ncbi:MAG: hypothetical protein JW867_01515 [Candidatus Omnitrophica bacterium]|nr:hypothetical protein [Candidatus Omnitrophota bacterium]
MNIKTRAFLICGNDFYARKRAIENIKTRILKGKAGLLNTSVVFSKEIELKEFQENLLTRSLHDIQLFIFKDFLELPLLARNFLSENIKKILAAGFLIFESEKDYYFVAKELARAKDRLFSVLLKGLPPVRAGFSKRDLSIYDFIKSFERKDLQGCLYVLENLYAQSPKQNQFGPQLIGVIVNNISKSAKSKQKQVCLSYVWDADRSIKEGGKDSRLILQTLLVKLLRPEYAGLKIGFAGK